MSAQSEGACLVVFGRAPVPGAVKTRLFQRPAAPPGAETSGRSLGPLDAARLYSAFLADVLDKGSRAGFSRRCLYLDGPLEHPKIAELAGQYDYALRPQTSGDLGARLSAAVAAELRDGARYVVVIGSDSPTLPAAYLEQAKELLSGLCEVVLGPATDGGYYLIGMARPRLELFAAGMPWGTAGVLPATLERLIRLGEAGVRSSLLPFFYDCDTPEDLHLLCACLRHARQQGTEDLSAPHTARALAELALI